MKIVRKSILVNLILAVICGTSMPWARSVKAEFAPLECVSGNCQIITQVQDTDLLKTFPASNTKVRLRLDTKNLVQANSTQETFSYRAYEINGSGQKEIISRTYVKFPIKAKNSKDYQVDLDIKPFIGTKKIYVEWFTSNDELALTNSFNVKATGSYANNQAESLNIGGSSVNKDAMIDFFVNNVKWTANTRGDAKAISVIPDQDTGTVEVNIPIIPSGLRAPLKRRKISYNETGTGFGAGGTATTASNQSIDDADSPLILGKGNIKALTSSEDPSVPVLVITSNRRIGINEDAPVATLDIAPGNNANALPIMKFGSTPLVSAPVNGAFEYDTAGDLYFTSNGVRKYFVLNPDSSSAVKKLESTSNPGKFLTLSGVNDVVLNGTAGVTLNLPSANGTVARLEDLGTLPPGSVNDSELDAGSVTNAKLGTNAVTTDKILDGTIKSADIEDGTITIADLNEAAKNYFNTTVPDGSITNPKLANGAVTTNKLGISAVKSSNIADNAVLESNIMFGAVTSSKILDQTIQTEDLDLAIITQNRLAFGAVTSVKIADGTIKMEDLDSSLKSMLSPSSLLKSSSTVGTDSVTSALIVDGTIKKEDLADDSVTNSKIVSVDASKITGAVPAALTTVKGVLAKSTLDFKPDHSYLTKVMTANTTFTATNLKQGSRYVLKLSGAFVPTFPAYFVLNSRSTYNPKRQNYFQFEVIDDSVGNPLVLVRLNQQPI